MWMSFGHTCDTPPAAGVDSHVTNIQLQFHLNHSTHSRYETLPVSLFQHKPIAMATLFLASSALWHNVDQIWCPSADECARALKRPEGSYLLSLISCSLPFLPLQVPEWCLDHWHPSEKAMYPDYFAKREQWKKLRAQSWDREVLPVAFHTSDRVRVCPAEFS